MTRPKYSESATTEAKIEKCIEGDGKKIRNASYVKAQETSMIHDLLE